MRPQVAADPPDHHVVSNPPPHDARTENLHEQLIEASGAALAT